MVWAVTARGQDTDTASSTNLVIPSFTPGANSLLVVALDHSNDAGSLSLSGHDDGVSWAQIYKTTLGGGREHELWACITGSSPSAGTITITKNYGWTYAAACVEITGDFDTSPSAMTDLFGTAAAVELYTTGADNTLDVTLSAFASADNMTLALAADEIEISNDYAFTEVQVSAGANNNDISVLWYDGADTNPEIQFDNWITARLSAIEVKEAAGGGATHTDRTLGDSIAIVDSPDRTVGYLRLMQDSVAAEDLDSAFREAYRVLDEAVLPIDDAARRSALRASVLASFVSVSDVEQPLRSLFRTLDDNTTVVDVLSTVVAGGVVRILTDTILVLDNDAAVRNLTRALLDSVEAADALIRFAAGLAQRTLSDSIEATDSLSSSQLAERLLRELVAASDSVQLQRELSRVVEDNAAIIDTLSHLFALQRVLGDRVELSDTAQSTISRFTLELVRLVLSSLVDGISIQDTLSDGISIQDTLSDGVKIIVDLEDP